MGDSYSSGTGAEGPNIGPSDCRRRHSNWAERYANKLFQIGIDFEFTNVACHGAETRHVLEVRQHPDVPLQIEAVGSNTDLVFLTMGGNDVNFKAIVQGCLYPVNSWVTSTPTNCANALTEAHRVLDGDASRGIESLEDRLFTILEALWARMHRGRVVLLDYPYLERNRNYTIPRTTYEAGRLVYELEDKGDRVQQRAVDRINDIAFQEGHAGFAVFLGSRPTTVKATFAGHEPASGTSPEGLYAHDFDWGGLSEESYHPNQDGHDAIAAVLFNQPDGERAFDALDTPFALEQPTVDPLTGTTAQQYTFSVSYNDQQEPTVAQVSIDGTPHSLTLADPATGTYRYGPMRLDAGTHTFYFTFANQFEPARNSQTRTFTVADPPRVPTGRNVRVASLEVQPPFAAPSSTVTLVASFANLGNQAETITAHWYLYSPTGAVVAQTTTSYAGIPAYTGSTGFRSVPLTTSSVHGAWSAAVWVELADDDDQSDNRRTMPFTVGIATQYDQYRLVDAVVRTSSPASPAVGGYSFTAVNFYDQRVDIRAYNGSVQCDSFSFSATSIAARTATRYACGGQYLISAYTYYYRSTTGYTLAVYHGVPTQSIFTYSPVQPRGPAGSTVVWRAQSTLGTMSAPAREDIVGEPTVQSWYADGGLDNGWLFRTFQVPATATPRTYEFHIRDKLQGSNDYYLRKIQFIVDAAHDVSVSQVTAGSGEPVAAGQSVVVSATVGVASSYVEAASVRLTITGPNNYLYTDSQVVSVSGTSAISFSRPWSTSGLPAGTYSVTVSAAIGSDINAANDSAAVSLSVVVLSPPAAPSLTSCSADSPTRVQLTWSRQSTNESEFRVERSPDSSNWSRVCSAPAAATGCSDTTVTPEQLYFYQVVARNGAGEASSNVCAVRPPPLPALEWAYPNGGQRIQRGKAITLNWMTRGAVPAVRVSLLKAGIVRAVLADGIPNAGALLWNVPPAQELGADYGFRVEDSADGTPLDSSDAYVSVVETEHTLAVGSTSPGVTISVSVADLSGERDGVSPFLRRYAANTSVTLTAPGTYAGAAFQSWEGASGQLSAVPSVTVGMTDDLVVSAIYAANPGALQLAAPSYTGSENAPTANIVVTRTGGSYGAVSVTVTTSDGTANAGRDYTAVSRVVSFAAGDVEPKTVPIPILSDTTYEGDETVNLALSAVTGGATLGTPATAVLTITDDDPAPTYPVPVSMTTTAPGPSATLSVTFRDPVSASEVRQVVILVSPNGIVARGAYFYYNSLTNLLYLRDDSNTTWGLGVRPGGGGLLSNSKVVVSAVGVSVQRSGRDFTITIPMNFRSALAGTNRVYAWADNATARAPEVSPLEFIVAQSIRPTVDQPPFSFDRDRKADVTVFRPTTGQWLTLLSTGGWSQLAGWGIPGDKPVPADYDGDGRLDRAVWRPRTGQWLILRSSGGWSNTVLGTATDVPVPADYDGDGRADLAVWRASTGTWTILRSTGGTRTIPNWGMPIDVPIPFDFDGDRKVDLALWRPSTRAWVVLYSSGGWSNLYWGNAGDEPVPGDYDGDGRTDIAVWRPLNGLWYVVLSTGGWTWFQSAGATGDIAVPGDYDGDGRTDVATWRPSTGTWTIVRSGSGSTVSYAWGVSGDVPIARR